jgi:selenocysteine-specific elongation factor
MTQRHAILATAGHIDHGKSSLVKALSGMDPDRLPEEKARGMTIDLGFAHLQLPGHNLGIVDVPGHQDFVKNMVAGVGAVDLALLVVAADDGWMPQTEEHLQILGYLGVTRGVVALAKADLVRDTVVRVEEIRDQLRNSPFAASDIIPLSTQTGLGLDELKAALSFLVDGIPPHEDGNQPRLAVDRTFTVQGIGTVVTGTLVGGTLQKGQKVALHPSGRETRIRGLQSHNCDLEVGYPGTRTAINLAGLSRAAVQRGETITLPELGQTTATLDVCLERSPRLPAEALPLRNNTRVRVHHGTGHAPARLVLADGGVIEPGQKRLAQLRFERSVCVWPGDRIVIRNWQETDTLAGGLALDVNGDRKKMRVPARTQLLEARIAAPNDPQTWIETQLKHDGIVKCGTLLRPSSFSPAQIDKALRRLLDSRKVVKAGGWIADMGRWQSTIAAMSQRVDAEHARRPELPGLPLEELRPLIEQAFPGHGFFSEIISDLCCNGFIRRQNHITRSSHKPSLPPHLKDFGEKIRQALQVPDPPPRKNFTENPTGRQALQFLIEIGEVIDVSPELVLGASQFYRYRLWVKQHLRKHGQATTSELRIAIDSTRRILIPLLEKMDRDGVTVRRGNVRVLRESI